MKAQSTMKSKLRAFFFPSWGYMFSKHRQYFWGVGGAPVCLSHISHCYNWSFNCCGHGYSNMAQAAQPCWPKHLHQTLHLEALLNPMYLSLTVFHFHSFTHKFLRSTLFKLGIPFLCATPSSVLGYHVTPLLTLSPLATTQCLQHSAWADSEYHDSDGIWTHQWQFLHTVLYQNRNNQLNVESHWPLPWEPTCNKFSEWCCPTFKSWNIWVLKTVFFSLLSCSIQCSALSTHTSLSNKSPWSSKSFTTR